MANVNETAFRVSEWFEQGSATAATATATRAAPPALSPGGVGAGRRHILTGILITASGAASAAGNVTVTGAKSAAAGGPTGTILHQIAIGANLAAGLFIPIRLEADAQSALSVAVASLGVTVSVTIFGFTTSA